MDGVFRRNDLLAAGLSRGRVDSLCRKHKKLRRGVYAPEADHVQFYSWRCETALQSVGPTAALAGPSAAFWWDLPLLEQPKEVTLRGLSRGGWARGTRVLNGSAEDQEHHGLRVTTPAWTVIDCARLLSLRDGLIIADAATHTGLCTLDELADVCAQATGRYGAAKARWVVANCDPAAESPGETWTRMVVRDLGYDIVSQYPVREAGFVADLDFLFEGTRVGLEFDGLVKYFGRQKAVTAVVSEKNRQASLEVLGYSLVRVIWFQLPDPDRLDMRLRNQGLLPSRPRVRRIR